MQGGQCAWEGMHRGQWEEMGTERKPPRGLWLLSRQAGNIQGIFRSDLELKGALWLLCGDGKQGRSWEACAIMHQIKQ